MRTLLIILLLISPLGASAAEAPSASAAEAPSGRQWFAGESSLFIEVNFQRLQQGNLFRDLYPLIGNTPAARQQLETLRTDLGIDIMSELHRITISMPPPNPSTPNVPPLILIQGSFDAAQLYERLKAKMPNATEQTIAGRPVAHTSEGQSQAMVRVEEGILVGSLERIQGALAAPGTIGGPIGELLGTLTAPNDILFAAYVPDMIRQAAAARNPFLGSFNRISGYIDSADGFVLRVGAREAEAGKAAALAALATAQLQQIGANPQALPFRPLLERIQVSAAQQHLNLSINLGMPEVAQLKGIAMMMMMGLAQQQQQRAAPPQPSNFPTLQRPASPPAGAPAAPAAPTLAPAPAPTVSE